MGKYYFTFGSNHTDKYGKSLFNKYVVVEAETYWEARMKLMAVRGARWSVQYPEDEKPSAIDRYNLTEVSLDDVDDGIDDGTKIPAI